MDIKRRGILFILSSPSGVGKSTLARLIVSKDRNISLSISVTTRSMRPMEKDGIDYHFKSVAAFKLMLKNDEFIEHAKVFNHYYGTPKRPIEQDLTMGRDVLLDVDWQGAQMLKQKCKQDLATIFLLPPNKKVLESRLRKRSCGEETIVAKRMLKFSDETSHYKEYDWVIVNDVLYQSLDTAIAIIKSERTKQRRQVDLDAFVQALMEQ